MKKLEQEIRENQKRLDSCSRHEFKQEQQEKFWWELRYRCSNCGGIVGHEEATWYERGLAHAIRQQKGGD